ncbi:uncharacterized protein [Henckelia pumila]|uniref:uncharacterized protein n=1 Tax=Henckelia pumila TaxID=405737 RepID=UPI003C6E1697
MIQQMTDAVEFIRKRIKAAQDRQASYANTRRIPLYFEVGEHVFLRVSPFRKVMKFGLKGKLSPRFIGPFEIFEKYVADESHILHPTEVQLDQDLSYVQRPLMILDRKDKVLCNKRIPLVMVQWQHRGTEEATWELENRIRAEHPELF